MLPSSHEYTCCAQLDMVLEPGGLRHQLVTGTSSGELKFVDFRVVDSSGQMGVWKTVEAHTKGAMTAMAAHPYSPLLATATATQVRCHGCELSSHTLHAAWSRPYNTAQHPRGTTCCLWVTNQT